MRIIASGTFDHLHEGHRFFLMTAFGMGHVLIGLAADALLREKAHAQSIQPYSARRSMLVSWLAMEKKRYGADYEILPITTRHGFATEIKDVDAILVTDENAGIGTEINRERALLGYPLLKIVKCNLVCDSEGKISSTRIRSLSSASQ